MSTTTISRRKFNQDTGKARKATALVHGMTAVTRNVAHFAAAGVALLNPWECHDDA